MDLNLIIGSSGLLGIAYLVFKLGRLTQKIDSEFHYIGNKFVDVEKKMDSRFLDLEKKIDKVIVGLEELKKDVTSLDMRLGKLEVRVEERTLRVIHVPHEDKEMAVR